MDSHARPDLSVIMGVFNNERFLSSAIESILSQTMPDFEFLIIDDASTDRSPAIVESYARNDARIIFERNEQNRGLGFVLNRGVRAARAELVARMDADDISFPERFAKQFTYLRSHPEIDVLGSYALDMDEHGNVLRERRTPITNDAIVKLVWANPLIHPTVMFRRDQILRIGSYAAEIRRRQDYELWFRCAQAKLKFENLPEPLLYYRHSKETLKRNDVRSMWAQVRLGIKGCKLVGAPPLAYAAVSMPLVEAIIPDWLRLRLHGLKKIVDPRRS